MKKLIVTLLILLPSMFVAPTPALPAAASSTPDIWFGKKDANDVEVMFVSDWYCPYCRKSETALVRLAPAVGKVARYTYLDLPIHKQSYEVMPYHLSILLNHKAKYQEGRAALLEVTERSKNPDDRSFTEAFARRGISLRLADFSTLMQLSANEAKMLKKAGVTMTPSIVIRNARTGYSRVLEGADKFNDVVIMAAIKEAKNK